MERLKLNGWTAIIVSFITIGGVLISIGALSQDVKNTKKEIPKIDERIDIIAADQKGVQHDIKAIQQQLDKQDGKLDKIIELHMESR